jgi:hypothetical protein
MASVIPITHSVRQPPQKIKPVRDIRFTSPKSAREIRNSAGLEGLWWKIKNPDISVEVSFMKSDKV